MHLLPVFLLSTVISVMKTLMNYQTEVVDCHWHFANAFEQPIQTCKLSLLVVCLWCRYADQNLGHETSVTLEFFQMAVYPHVLVAHGKKGTSESMSQLLALLLDNTPATA